MQEAKSQAQASKTSSSWAQVPSVGQLPCSAENLIEGMLAKSALHLVDAPEKAGFAEEQLLPKRNAAFEQRPERAQTERAVVQVAEQVSKAEAKRLANEQPAIEAALDGNAVATQVDMEVEDLNDNELAEVDPSNVRPMA